MADAIDHSRGASDNDNDAISDVELEFELDEHGRVCMIRDGDCCIIGRKLATCVEMRRFLATVAQSSGKSGHLPKQRNREGPAISRRGQRSRSGERRKGEDGSALQADE